MNLNHKVETNPLVLRASKIGGCVRGYVMDLRNGGEPEPTPKAKIYFAVGKALEPVIMEAAGYDAKLLLNDSLEVRTEVNGGVVLVGHPDAHYDDWVIECKTMRSHSFKKMVDSSIFEQFPQYLIQGAVYCRALGAKGVVYLCLDKDASLIHKVMVEMWEISMYWDKAQANAEKIQAWVGKQNLPGRSNDLPSWHCNPSYCLRHDCRYNWANRPRRA